MKTSDEVKWIKAPGGHDDGRAMKVQALSGAVFAVFLLVHLLNQALAVLGERRYDEVQRALRAGYQAPVLEVVLVLAPLLLHVFASVKRMWLRRGAEARPVTWRLTAHRWSGRFLLLVFIGHVAATRGASALFDVFPGFAGLAFTFRWVPAYFWPYYLLLALTGWYHVLHGLSVAMPLLGVRAFLVLQRKPVFLGLLGAGGLALVGGVLALGGVFFDVGDPAGSAYAKLVLRLTAR
jgi:hypothetical protein